MPLSAARTHPGSYSTFASDIGQLGEAIEEAKDLHDLGGLSPTEIMMLKIREVGP